MRCFSENSHLHPQRIAPWAETGLAAARLVKRLHTVGRRFRTVRIADLKSNSGLLRSLVFFFNVRGVVQPQMNALRFHRKQFQI